MSESPEIPEWLDRLHEAMDPMERQELGEVLQSIIDFVDLAGNGSLGRELTDEQIEEMQAAGQEFADQMVEILSPPWEVD